MPYWELFYHVVWSTKNRLPLLTPDIEQTVYGFLRAKAVGLQANVFALNGVVDHVHMVVSIPPKIAVSKFIGQVKAVAATKLNKSGLSSTPFYWQEEYSVFSFDRKRLPNFIAYVERQKIHHGQGTTIPVLERTDSADFVLVEEPSSTYAFEDDAWRRELDFAFSPGDEVAGLPQRTP